MSAVSQEPHPAHQESIMSKFTRYAGIFASIALIALGIGTVVVGANGRDRVRSDLAREQIVGTPDSTIPGQKVDTGAEAQAFAKVMRKHTLEATGGQTYAQMGRYLDANGKPTNDEKAAAVDPKTNKPVENGLRNMWVNETALTTALNTAYFAESVSTYVIVMGIALLLSGAGFLVLTLRVLGPEAIKPRSTREVAASEAALQS
jgi:uncharacterized membrane protein